MLVQSNSLLPSPRESSPFKENSHCGVTVPPLDFVKLFAQPEDDTPFEVSESLSSSSGSDSDDDELLTEEGVCNSSFADALKESKDEDDAGFARVMYPNSTEVRFEGDICTPAMLKAVTENFVGMKALHLRAPQEKSYQDIKGEDLIEVVRQHPAIQSLSLRGIPNITQEQLTKILSILTNLTALELGGGIEVTDDLLNKILSERPIDTLTVDGESLTSKGWAALAAHGARFKELCLSSIDRELTQESVEALSTSLKNVRKLTLKTRVGLSDAAMKALAENARLLRWCSLDNSGELSLEGLQALSKLPLKVLSLGNVKHDLALACAMPYKMAGIRVFINGIAY